MDGKDKCIREICNNGKLQFSIDAVMKIASDKVETEWQLQ